MVSARVSVARGTVSRPSLTAILTITAFHGAGEQVRGTVNEFVDKVGDSITGKQAGENGNAAKGAETVRAGELETEQGRRMLEPERPPQNM
jgi:hypothetical protein